MSVDRAKLNLCGWLRKPLDLTIDGKVLRQVVRIIGNFEWGYLYEIKRGDKYFKTSEPLWHEPFHVKKRNDLPALGQSVKCKHGDVIVKEFKGFGWYDATDSQGKVISLHFFDMQKQ